MFRRAIKFVFFIAALGAGGLLALATTVRETVAGSGVPMTQERTIENVNQVEFSGVGELTIVSGAAPTLSVTADDNILPVLETEASDGQLTIDTRSRTTIHPKTKIVYTLTVPRLDAIDVSGAGSVTTKRFETDDLKVKLSGAGKAQLDNLTCHSLSLSLSGAGIANLSGSTEKLTLRISGAGNIDAAKLKAKSADAAHLRREPRHPLGHR